jgi:hypothetical protein
LFIHDGFIWQLKKWKQFENEKRNSPDFINISHLVGSYNTYISALCIVGDTGDAQKSGEERFSTAFFSL